MPWPLSQDYNEAIQSPALCFNDLELKQAEATCNAIGLPMPCSGNFADVYEMGGPSGKKWAVKCFTRQVSGLRERYGEISAYLKQVNLPFMVDFAYLDPGIKVRGQWFPVLKMDWVEGFTLNGFVKQHADNPPVLEALCQIWVRLARRLREAGMAHCDLQHGNVLLVPGSKATSLGVRLIDYDGMWVPALAGRKSGEVGHPAYQHPQRLREGIYTAEVDRFPHLVIYTALRALMVRSRYLWNKYDNGDNLLFRQADLDAPGNSALFQELRQVNDPDVQKLVGTLSQAAQRPLEQTPLLDELVGEQAQGKRKSAVVPVAKVEELTAAEVFSQTTTGDVIRRRQSSQRSYVGVMVAAFVVLAGLVVGGVMLMGMSQKPTDTALKVAVVPPPPMPTKKLPDAPPATKPKPTYPAPKPREPAPKPPDPETKNDRPIDLLKLIKPAQHTVMGMWHFDGNTLSSSSAKGPNSKITVPYAPGEAYVLRIVAEHKGADSFLGIGLVIGKNQTMVMLNPYSQISGLGDVDHKFVPTYKGALFPANRPSEIICTARKTSLTVTVDGVTVVNWTGDPSRFSMNPYWAMPSKTELFLCTHHKCVYSITRLELTPITGEGKPLDERPPPEKPKAEKSVSKQNGADEAWLKSIASLPPEKQAEEVITKLKELNPGFDGKETHQINGGVVTSLHFRTENVTDISPLRALMGLKGLYLSGGKGRLATLSPLQGMSLTYLDCRFTQVSDLSPLKGMPLQSLALTDTQVSDLSPLKEMPLTFLLVLRCRELRDLSPLRGMPLTYLNCSGTKVADLSPLKGMALTELYCSGTKVSDLSVIKDMPLRVLGCDFRPERDTEILRSIKTLEKINFKPVAEFWKGLK